MNKKILTVLVLGFLVFILTGCNSKKDSQLNNDEEQTFNATIIECDSKSMIVRPDEIEEEYKSSDKIRVEYVNEFKSCNVNDKVKITYKGGINESYPAQIGTTKIEKITE